MSTSTNASKGTPDDDEGRLADDSTSTPAELASEDASDAVDDEAVDAEADDVEDSSDVDDSGDSSEDEDSEEDETVASAAVAASAARRTPAKRSTGGKPATDAKPAGGGSGKPPARKRPAAPRPAGRGKDERRGPIAAIVLFVRQVISELRKVVTPTGRELGTYVAVVIVFVLIVMAYVGVLDLAVGKLVLWAFGG